MAWVDHAQPRAFPPPGRHPIAIVNRGRICAVNGLAGKVGAANDALTFELRRGTIVLATSTRGQSGSV